MRRAKIYYKNIGKISHADIRSYTYKCTNDMNRRCMVQVGFLQHPSSYIHLGWMRIIVLNLVAGGW